MRCERHDFAEPGPVAVRGIDLDPWGLYRNPVERLVSAGTVGLVGWPGVGVRGAQRVVLAAPQAPLESPVLDTNPEVAATIPSLISSRQIAGHPTAWAIR